MHSPRWVASLLAASVIAGASTAHAAPALLGSSNDEYGYSSAIHTTVTNAVEAGLEVFLLCRVDNSSNGTQTRGGRGTKIRIIPGSSGEITLENPIGSTSAGRCKASTGVCDAWDNGVTGGVCTLGWKMFQGEGPIGGGGSSESSIITKQVSFISGSSTRTVPADALGWAKIQLWGPGGNGGTATAYGYAGAGGGGYAEKIITINPSDVISYTVGAPGTATAALGVTAGYGANGSSSTGAGGAGGTSSGGDTNSTGSTGSNSGHSGGGDIGGANGGNAAASWLASGTGGSGGGAYGDGATGAGSFPGGGGGVAGGSPRGGRNGANGLIIITYLAGSS